MSGAVTQKSKASVSNRAPSPIADVEFSVNSKKTKKQNVKDVVSDDDEEEELLNEEAATFADKLKGEQLSFAIRTASKEIAKETGKRSATDEEVADKLGISAQYVHSSRAKLRLLRQGARLGGIRKAALKAGYSRRQNASRFETRGLDIEQSLLTTADIQRMARSIPLNYDKGSYSPEENAMRLSLMHDTLPVGAAREIVAFVEPLFRNVVGECVDRQARLKTSRISPSTMHAVLKKYADLGVFTALVPPAGLVRFAKEQGVGVDYPRSKNPNELMGVTEEDKKGWKAAKKHDKVATEKFSALVDAEAQRKLKKQKVVAAKNDDSFTEAVEKTKKDKKAKRSSEDDTQRDAASALKKSKKLV